MRIETIGQGWAFPLRVDTTGSVALVGAETEIEESIRLILGTSFGERPMRPEFGCGIHDHVFGSLDATTAGQIAYEVQASLVRWEPRIEVDSVDVDDSGHSVATLLIRISYTLRDDNDPRNLVFPFYVIPAEGVD
jgi:phage baseplate assembly protein W